MAASVIFSLRPVCFRDAVCDLSEVIACARGRERFTSQGAHGGGITMDTSLHMMVGITHFISVHL